MTDSAGRCYDWVEINDGSSTKRYCGPLLMPYNHPDNGDYYSNTGFNNNGAGFNAERTNLGPSIPGPFTSTGTIMTVKFFSNNGQVGAGLPGGGSGLRTGFLAIICCSVHVTTDLTSGELINTVNRSTLYSLLQ